MASTIGIKLANGEFYPVLTENSQEKKRMVLTTVHDNQRSIQIDLYRSPSRTMVDALYIGSLVMESLTQQPKGQPSIELVIASSSDGDINAHAVDLDGSAEGRQTLSVSLKSLDEVRQDYEITDIDLENELAPPKGLYEPVGITKQNNTLLSKVIIVVIILLLLLLAIWFLFFRNGGILPCIQQLFGRSQSSGQSQAPSVSQPLPSPSPAVQTPVAQAPAAQTPAVQSPAAQAPAVQTSAAQAPAVQSPAVQTPVAQTPAQPAQTETAMTPAPVVESSPAPAPAPVIIQAPAEPPPVVQVDRTRPPAPVASYNVPAVIPTEGVAYRVRYGDTLWDISEAFYRNPWLYPRIARFNNISNPDRIISGTTIRVPPRN